MLSRIAGAIRSLGAHIDEERFVFLHVPKTAGSAVKAAIEKSAHRERFECLPHRIPFSGLSRSQARSQTFLTIRKPVDWYLSLYNFKMHSAGDKGYAGMERNSLDDFLRDVVFVENGAEGILRWNRPLEYKRHVIEMAEAYARSGASERIGFLTVNLLFYGARDWRSPLNDVALNEVLADPSSNVLSVRHILRQEFLQQDMEGMLSRAGITVSTREKVNAMSGNPYRATLPPQTIAQIEQRDSGVLRRYYPGE